MTQRGGRLHILPGEYTAPVRAISANRELTFRETLTKREPTLEYILNELPTEPEENCALIEMMENDTLVAGCNGGDDQNGIFLFGSI